MQSSLNAGKAYNYNLTLNNLEKLDFWDFNYTGTVQSFVAPADGTYQLEAWGAGGEYHYSTVDLVGYGGYVKGVVALKSGQSIFVYVGRYGNGKGTGNWNGGGQALVSEGQGNAGYGGGATDFRLLPAAASDPTVWNTAASLNSRIMVAGAGGGFGDSGWSKGDRGHAGGLQGYDNNSSGSKGGTQIGGGYSGGNDFGYFGLGGKSTLNYGGSGGGGYYGGAGGQYSFGHGSGGSSFISGMPGCVAISPSATNDPRTQDTGNDPTALNYSNATFGASPTWADDEEIRFTEISMVDGTGYEWSSGAKGTQTGMPDWSQPAGTTMTGNTGAGHARITCLTCQP
jgi:hypothetical protein